MNIKIKV